MKGPLSILYPVFNKIYNYNNVLPVEGCPKLPCSMSFKTILTCFSGFISVCPTGMANKENILEMYAMPKHKAKIFINQIFKLFDKDGSGDITFRVTICLAEYG